MPLPFAAGDAVVARGERWLVEDTTAFDDCTVVHLTTPGDRAGDWRRASLLHPFDRPSLAQASRKVRVVTKRRWMRNLQSRLPALRAHGQLRSARRAAIDIFPFQLEPALALVRGHAARFLLADEVGLGKTIQAALMLAELQQRGWCERALVLSPAGLCQQWAGELGRRFQIAASVFDASSVRRFAAELPFHVNPWSVQPVLVTSIDFIKQPEVLRAVTSIVWDVVIIDEAHQAATAPRRTAAVKMLASRARHVVLVTATPHAGDEAAYRSLCAMGEIDAGDPLLIFRRTRETIGLNRTRKVHLLRVRPGPYEIEMHRLLGQYAKRLWQVGRTDTDNAAGARLVAMVFSKRAMSSASSLAISLEKRIAGLPAPVEIARQSGLPFAPDEDDESASDAEPTLAVPAFEQLDDEERVLRTILAAAERARKNESKVAALVRLLRRVGEPVIVFTEYRDTLAMLEQSLRGFRRISMLHGGLSPAERDSAVHVFNSGASDLLLATDAGAEGLNLQSRCRLVVNLELPWNPIRLEQRIGRVDRLGQSRTVHAIHLFADDTAEGTVLANLHRRLRRIRASEIDIAACVIDGSDIPQHVSVQEDTTRVQAQITEEAEAEALRLSRLARSSPAAPSHRDYGHTAVNVFRSRTRKTSSTFWFFQARILNGSGRLVEELLLPVQLPVSTADLSDIGSSRPKRRDVTALADHLVERFRGVVASTAQTHVERRAVEIARESRAWVGRAIARERRLSQLVAADDALFQAGLFETRSLKHRENIRTERQRLVEESACRTGYLELDAVTSLAQQPELVLLLIQC